MKTYRVIRKHIGDRTYLPGDERQGEFLEHLVPRVLQPISAKAEPALNNKAEGAAPANKASTGRKAK
jgi:hypothetical protein